MLALKSAPSKQEHQTGLLDSTVLGSGLPDRSLRDLFCITSRKEVPARATIVWEGDAGNHVFEVVSGVVKLYKLTLDGRRQVTGFVYPGQLLGLVDQGNYIYTAEAVTDTVLALYPRSKLDQMADRMPGLARRLLALALGDLVAAQEQMLLLGRRSATEKIASFLLRLSRSNEARGETASALFLPMTRTDIGDYLGLTTETVSRVINRLKDQGVLSLRRHKYIEVRDLGRLEDLADAGCEALEC